MIDRINRYLLTHYPLLWNIRIVWVLLSNVLLHLLFFLAGFASLSATSIKNFYSVESVGGESLITFSVLCSVLVLLVWLVFYLRNNAFKSMYRISSQYLVKEFLLIFIVVLTSISYFFSYQSGVRTRGSAITNSTELSREAALINTAFAFLPQDKQPYFILNNCDERKIDESQDRDTDVAIARTMPDVLPQALDTTGPYYDTAYQIRLRAALRRPDAFSYRHYCQQTIFISSDTNLPHSRAINQQINIWLNTGNSVAIKSNLENLFTICNKYGLDYKLSAEKIVISVFSAPGFTKIVEIPTQREVYENGVIVQINPYYFRRHELQSVINFLDDCQLSRSNFRERKEEWMAMGYVALVLSIILLCYRRFSRRVFLISVVGAIVWAIIIGLMMAGAGSIDAFYSLMLLLTFGFLLAGVMMLRGKSGKTATGVMFCWHAVLAPFIVVFIVGLVDRYLNNIRLYQNSALDRDNYLQHYHPIAYWIEHHTTDIFLVNLFLVLFYIAFLFNRWARSWQAMPEE